jgi:light-regulated signal transduction histidine kinase (bacteriophytochrome)
MSKHLLSLKNQIEKASLLPDSVKTDWVKILASVQEELSISEANLKTSEDDRILAINYLNETIADLEENHKQLKKANKFLAHQNEIIDSNLQKLISAYEELEQFTYIASHDLKSPLRTISSYAQLLKSRYSENLDSKANDYIDIIIKSMQNMTEVINESLAYSRIGKEGVRRTQPISLQQVIEIVKSNLDTEIKETSAIIEYDELPTIIGRKTNFIQLFQNLISNSIKYKSKEHPVINIKSKVLEDAWQIELTDNGLGIDEKYHKTIFQPFKRLNHESLGGAGLGLAISKKICKMYNGSIQINSKLNKGTTFILQLKDLIHKEI